MTQKSYNQGLIRWIVLVIAVILVLSYFSVDIRAIAEKARLPEFFAYIWSMAVLIWSQYIVVAWENFIGLSCNFFPTLPWCQ